MKIFYFSCFAALFILFSGISFAGKVPHEIAGITLGENVDKCRSLLEPGTSFPVRYQEYLVESGLKQIEGYKSGTITYGTCAKPGQIVRIKLKYLHSEEKFFDELLERFKERFGEPDEWRGDPFQVIIAWKWSFKDRDGNMISLILQHSKDEEYKYGNSVKLTNWTLMKQERQCYERQHPESSQSQTASEMRRLKAKDYRRFVPK